MGVLSKYGFSRPSYEEILKSQVERAKRLFGQDIETGEQTALGKFIRITCKDLAEMYEDLEGAYYARFPNTASGTSLDRLCVFAGISRNPPSASVHRLKIYGAVGYTIPVGFLVGTDNDINFYNLYETAIGENGETEIIVQAVDFGEKTNVSVGDIIKIINPVAGVASIKHISVVAYGADAESDTELRKRFSLAVAGSGSATAEAIRGNVMRVDGVKSALVIENQTDETDSEGRAPHTFECYVNTDDLSTTMSDNIASAIFEKKPIGIRSCGDIEVDILDESGNSNLIYFTRITKVFLSISIDIFVTNKFETGGIKNIKDNLIEYINSLGNGEDVIFSSLYSCIYPVAGVKEVINLNVKADGVRQTSTKIPLSPSQTAYLIEENISIGVNDYVD